MKADILIKRGHVIDAYQGIDEVRDIAVKDGLIVSADQVSEADRCFDASGCIVTPGLIDFHVHAFVLSSELAISPETMCFPTGVTTIVDAGSAGVANYEAFRVAAQFSRVRQFSYLHVNSGGIASVKFPESHDPKGYETEKILSLLKKYPELLGLKVRESKNVVGNLGLEPLKIAIEISAQADKNVACHVTDGPVPSNELVKLFRSGDVYAHVYHGKGYTILGEDGHVMPEFFEARRRGVLFDAAVGKSHFAFSVAQAALEDGFLPDIISTDATVYNAWTDGVAFSLPAVMSRFMAIGMPLPDIVKCTTVNPARALGYEEDLGSLAVGTCADIAVHRIIHHEMRYNDPVGGSFVGQEVLDTKLTVRDGNVVYRSITF